MILKSKLFENIISLVVLQGFSYIFPLVLVPFLLNKLGVEIYGLVNFAQAIIIYLGVVISFGFDLSAVKNIVAYRNNLKRINDIYNSVLIIKFSIFMILLAVLIILAFFVNRIADNFVLFGIWYFSLLGEVLFPTWFYQGIGELKYITKISIVIKSVTLFPLLLLIHDENDFLFVPIAYVFSNVFSGIFGMYYAWNKFSMRFYIPKMNKIIYCFRDSLPFFITKGFQSIYINSNVIFIGFFIGNAAVGIYSVAEKLNNAYAAVIAPLIQRVFYPYFLANKNVKRINEIVKILTVANIVFVFVLYFVCEPLIRSFVRIDNMEIIRTFQYLLLACGTIVPMLLLGYPYLGALGRINEANKTIVYASIFHIGVLFLFYLFKVNDINVIALLLGCTQLLCIILRVLKIKKILRLQCFLKQ